MSAPQRGMALGAQTRGASRVQVQRTNVGCAQPARRSSNRCLVQAIAGHDSPIPQWQAVLFWGRRHGISAEKLHLSEINGLRGMRAKEEISNGETIIRLPYSSTIHVHPYQAAPAPFQHDLDCWSRCSWDVKLALSLLAYKLQGQFTTYINQLPSSVNLPVFWSNTIVEQLQNPWVVKEVEQQRAKLQSATSHALPLLRCIGATEADFSWAYSIVQSRSYGGPYFLTKTTHKLIATAVLEVLTVSLSRCHILEPLDASLLGMSLLLLLLVGELVLAQTMQQHTLCPVIDLLNHSSSSQSYCTLDYFSNQFKVVADRGYQPGEQVAMSYGQLSNDTLLLRYGFVEPNNPHDHCVVTRLPDTLRAAGLVLSRADEESLSTVCVTRSGVSSATLERLVAAVRGSEQSALSRWLPASKHSMATARALMAVACRSELEAASTTLEQDMDMLNSCSSPELRVAMQFRIEKKKVLQEGAAALEALGA